MKKTSKVLILSLFALLLIIPLSVDAFTVKANDTIYVGENETLDGTLYAAGSNITIDGKVTGDVICGGQTININGEVDGDVICGGQTININGIVNGNIRVAATSININGSIARNVMLFGSSIALGHEAEVGWDVLLAGAIAEIRGKIGRDLSGAIANITIAGEITGDVKLKIDDKIRSEKKGWLSDEKNRSQFNITNDAIINGELSYTSINKASVEDGAIIIGETKHNIPKIKDEARNNFASFYGFLKIYSIFSSLVIGLVLISLWSEKIKKMTDIMLDKTGASIGWGIVIMFITPILAILLIITLIGIPLAGLLMLVWLIALWLSKIFVGILIGRRVLEKLWKKHKDSMIWAMIIGIIITQIIFAIPLIGWLLCLAAIWWGLGGLFIYLKKA